MFVEKDDTDFKSIFVLSSLYDLTMLYVWSPALVKINYFYCLSFINFESLLELFLSVI